MSTTNSSSIETRATTYEELIQSLDAQADILQYLPSEAEVDELFDEIHGESLLNSSSRRSSTPKLAFGTYREDGINVAQVYVYLRSPSFKNTEPSMMFGKCLANTKYTVMNTKDINCTDGKLSLFAKVSLYQPQYQWLVRLSVQNWFSDAKCSGASSKAVRV
jgi:hypothetical protein